MRVKLELRHQVHLQPLQSARHHSIDQTLTRTNQLLNRVPDIQNQALGLALNEVFSTMSIVIL
jgi:hypothetical protein